MEELNKKLELKKNQLASCIQLISGIDQGILRVDPKGAKSTKQRLINEIADLNEEIRNKRMNVIGQNGNEGTHYNDRNLLQTLAKDEE